MGVIEEHCLKTMFVLSNRPSECSSQSKGKIRIWGSWIFLAGPNARNAAPKVREFPRNRSVAPILLVEGLTEPWGEVGFFEPQVVAGRGGQTTHLCSRSRFATVIIRVTRRPSKQTGSRSDLRATTSERELRPPANRFRCPGPESRTFRTSKNRCHGRRSPERLSPMPANARFSLSINGISPLPLSTRAFAQSIRIGNPIWMRASSRGPCIP